MTNYQFIMLSWQLCSLVMLISSAYAITIDTRSGKVIGLEKSVPEHGSIYQFLNIPYAKPPVGERRFHKPEPYGFWTDTLNATTFGPSCMQSLYLFPFPTLPNTDINEDCLSLNIYAPYDTNNRSNRSVMVWIHGGGFLIGQGMAYDPTNLALVGNVVVVTINYRLGVFGFFSTGELSEPGNYGLWDQKLALEWVKENIQWYGGNPNSVTIFGESAGAMSVTLLAVSPICRGLFQRVIAQSGDASLPIVVGDYSSARQNFQIFSNSLGCVYDNRNTSYAVECLKTKTADELLSAQNSVPTLQAVVDGEIIVDYPYLSIQNTSSDAYTFFRSLDFISGVNSADGAEFLRLYIPQPTFPIQDGIPTDYVCNVLIPAFFSQIPEIGSSTNKKNAICKKYRDTSSIASQGREVVDMFTDNIFLIPSIQSLTAHSYGSSTGRTYQYLFARFNELAKRFMPRHDWVKGAAHGDELVFLFGLEEVAKSYGEELSPYDILFIRQMTEYWTNFAKTGDPNGNRLPVWPEYNATDKLYLLFDCEPTQQSELYEDRVKFWMEDISNIGNEETTSPSTKGTLNKAPSLLFSDFLQFFLTCFYVVAMFKQI